MDAVTCNPNEFSAWLESGPGRPRKDVAVPTANAVCKLARSFSQEALETLVEMMRNAELPGNVRIKACEAVLNRGIGLPAVAVDVTVQRVLAKKLCECTVEERRNSHIGLVFAGLLFESRTSIGILVLRVRKELDREDVGIAVDDSPEQR
jgi:hypothetical protein